MSASEHKHTSPSAADGDGVRIIREPTQASWPYALTLLALALVAVGIGYVLLSSPSTPTRVNEAARATGTVASARDVVAPPRNETDTAEVKTPSRRAPAHAAPTDTSSADLRSGDDNDIATYVSPSDPEPSMAEVIQALRDSGEHGGIAAFNPPGTSPPLKGLAVPEDFVLPQGYVRHHQVTDQGEPIEPILMYAPDFVLLDASGKPIPIPEDRVVPPELAPPGLPIRPITIPPPPE